MILLGVPGSGKTTIGTEVARRLTGSFSETDQIIADIAGRDVADFFISVGEEAFREVEKTATLQLLEKPGVIALGEGTVLDPTIRQQLEDASTNGALIIHLKVDLSQAISRIGLDVPRPLGVGMPRAVWKSLSERSNAIWEDLADFTLDTSNCTVAESADKICALLAASQQ